MGRRAVTVALSTIAIISACASPIPTPINVTLTPNLLDEKVDVGGYALRIHCTGQGIPTVVVEASFGEAAVEPETSSWETVETEIAKTTRICVYDRAGLGSSDVAPEETRTSKDMAQALHTLLVNAKIPDPYVLVGHSLGGYHARVFAGKYPKEVVGLVLVDSSHPDQWSETATVLPAEAPDEPFLLKQMRMIPPASLPEKLDIPTSIEQVRAVKSLADLPLFVVTRSPTWRNPELPLQIEEKIEQIWQRLQNDLAGLSTNSTHVIATNGGHYIQVDEPQLVIDAILKVLNEAGK
jgi:pimeloyl-ACP methyl ester carboxylesterase